MIGRVLLIMLNIVALAGVANGEGDDAAWPKRVALVVGNGAYDDSASILANPANDAAAIAAKFRNLGIEVIEALDLDHKGMRDTLRKFDRALQGADAGLFYYAGHAMEYHGQNYLLPTDAILEIEGDVGLGLIDMDQVLHLMEAAVPTRLVFLDACRNNPLAGNFRRSLGASREASVGRGLARMKSAVGTFIAYATAPGDVAADGEHDNSPFTSSMLTHLDDPGLDISQLMQRVRNSVIEVTKEKQVPWDSSSLRGPFILNLNITINPPERKSSSTTASEDQRAEKAFWDSIIRTDVELSEPINFRFDFIEANRETIGKLGFDWQTMENSNNVIVGLIDSKVFHHDQNGSTMGRSLGEVAKQIDDMDSRGLINILASPNLSMRHGEPGSFLAGGEIPIPTPGRNGSDETTIDYKPFGIAIDLMAERLPRERISLRYRTDISKLRQQDGLVIDGRTFPTLLRQRAEADVLLTHGQTLALAGLYESDALNNEKHAVLRDVPVLGTLFRSERFHREETELIVLITPFLSEPAGKASPAIERISAFEDYLALFGDNGSYAPLATAWINELKREQRQLRKSEAGLKFDRYRVQQALLTLGYDIGEIDGIFGSQTRQGIRAWQEKNRVEVTSYLSAGQIEKILEEAASVSERAGKHRSH